MKIIFLDIDGVLNTDQIIRDYSKRHNKYDVVSSELISKLNKIVEKTKAKVVISSSWRNVFSKKKIVNKYLIPNGFKGEVIDTTRLTRSSDFGFRGQEIQEWLNEHPNVTSFVVLDDISFGLDNIKENFVETDCALGIQNSDVEKAINILNGTARII